MCVWYLLDAMSISWNHDNELKSEIVRTWLCVTYRYRYERVCDNESAYVGVVIVYVVFVSAYWSVTVCMYVIYWMVLCIIGGRNRVEPVGAKMRQNVIGEGTGLNRWVRRWGKIYYQRKAPSWTEGDWRRVLLLFNILEDETVLNQRWSKGSTIIISLKCAWHKLMSWFLLG